MKSISPIAVLVIFTMSLAPAQTKQEGAARGLNAEQDLAQLEAEFYEAYTNGEAAKIDRLLAADYTHNDIRGGFKTRAAYMMYINTLADRIKAGAIKIDSSATDDLRVRVYGDTAVVTGRWTARGRRGGKDDAEQLRFLNVWVKQQGHWQTVAGQVTMVQK
jgi:ketosteroid isomerase-like protein